EIIAQRLGAICRATVDGAVWISHLKRKKAKSVPFYKRWMIAETPDFKLPAAMVLGSAALTDIEESSIEPLFMGTEATYKEIWYEEKNNIGYLHFNFHNGAMSTEQCYRLLEAYRAAKERPTRVIVLMGGTDFWSNGIHLNTIEAAKDPAGESWRNINAIDDVVYEIITTNTHLTLSAVWGGAGAGGAIMPLASDRVCVRGGCVMNPHYKTMGLYGSEYWTYLLPKRVGTVRAVEMMQTPLPIGMKKAKEAGMIDDILADDYDQYLQQVTEIAETMANDANFGDVLQGKIKQRTKDEQTKPLAAYRAAELKQMRLNFSGKFYGGDQIYHEARYNFVHKIRPKQTADYLAKHHQLDSKMFHELTQTLTY
ncbi:MAG: hydrogenase maturation protein, partial [Methyloprofundus sp.]|nr:hydrogenase maturation protein [Methyloprofundus sp.]